MLGVMIGDKHTFYDLGLWLTKYPQISTPAPKTKTVDVPGADGALDLSRTLTGHMQYNRRTIEMQFTILAARMQWPEIHSEIMDLFHGRELDVTLDDDPEYCYTGTISVQGFDSGKATDAVTITADVEPYKTRMDKTCLTFSVSGSLTRTITGSRKPVTPTISASAAMQMTFGDVTYSLKKGENVLPDVIIREGGNTFTFRGTGSVILEYREGRF